MHTKHKNTSVYRYTLFILLLLGVLCFLLVYFPEITTKLPMRSDADLLHRFVPNPPHLSETPRFMKTEEIPTLSTQETSLLEQLKTDARAYTAQLTNGEIEFSVTLYRKSPSEPDGFFVALWEAVWKGARNRLKPPNELIAEKPQAYDSIGEWDITYRFDKHTEFFDVKAHKKREMNDSQIITRTPDGKLRNNIWLNTHHQFIRDKNQTLYILDGTVWKSYDKWRQSLSVSTHATHFDQRYNPHWWHLGYATGFDTFIRHHKTTDIKTVDIDGSSQVYLQLYHTDQVETTSNAKTIELWMHPQTGIHPKRILIGRRTAGMDQEYEEGWMFDRPKPIPGKFTYGESINFRNITSKLAQYEPGIWFPDTVTEKHLSGASLSKLFPDLPRSEYPVIMSEAHLPEWFREEYQNAPLLKRVMKVHRADFNLPNLQIPIISP